MMRINGTLAWFDCFTVDKSNGNDILIISMLENEQNNPDGGTHYLMGKNKDVLKSI